MRAFPLLQSKYKAARCEHDSNDERVFGDSRRRTDPMPGLGGSLALQRGGRPPTMSLSLRQRRRRSRPGFTGHRRPIRPSRAAPVQTHRAWRCGLAGDHAVRRVAAGVVRWRRAAVPARRRRAPGCRQSPARPSRWHAVIARRRCVPPTTGRWKPHIRPTPTGRSVRSCAMPIRLCLQGCCPGAYLSEPIAIAPSSQNENALGIRINRRKSRAGWCFWYTLSV